MEKEIRKKRGRKGKGCKQRNQEYDASFREKTIVEFLDSLNFLLLFMMYLIRANFRYIGHRSSQSCSSLSKKQISRLQNISRCDSEKAKDHQLEKLKRTNR